MISTELCQDRVSYVATECGQDQSALRCNRVGQGKEFYVTTEYFCVAIEFGLGQSSCVAIEYFMLRQSMAK